MSSQLFSIPLFFCSSHRYYICVITLSTISLSAKSLRTRSLVIPRGLPTELEKKLFSLAPWVYLSKAYIDYNISPLRAGRTFRRILLHMICQRRAGKRSGQGLTTTSRSGYIQYNTQQRYGGGAGGGSRGGGGGASSTGGSMKLRSREAASTNQGSATATDASKRRLLEVPAGRGGSGKGVSPSRNSSTDYSTSN